MNQAVKEHDPSGITRERFNDLPVMINEDRLSSLVSSPVTFEKSLLRRR